MSTPPDSSDPPVSSVSSKNPIKKYRTGFVPVLVLLDILIIGVMSLTMISFLVAPKSSDLALLTITPTATTPNAPNGPTIWLGLFRSCAQRTNTSPITCSKLVHYPRYDLSVLGADSAIGAALKAMTPPRAFAVFLYMSLCTWCLVLLSSCAVIKRVNTVPKDPQKQGYTQKRRRVQIWLKYSPWVLLFPGLCSLAIYVQSSLMSNSVGIAFTAYNTAYTATIPKVSVLLVSFMSISPVLVAGAIYFRYRATVPEAGVSVARFSHRKKEELKQRQEAIELAAK